MKLHDLNNMLQGQRLEGVIGQIESAQPNFRLTANARQAITLVGGVLNLR